MPALGQTTDELTIVRWLKAEGERVEPGEPLLEVETDKVTMAVEAATGGTLLRILCADGETVLAGTVIAYLGQPGEAVPEAVPEEALELPPREATPGPAVPRAPAAGPAPAGRVLATPAGRQLAREHGIDLEQVRGSGPGGVVERRDVLELIGQGDGG